MTSEELFLIINHGLPKPRFTVTMDQHDRIASYNGGVRETVYSAHVFADALKFSLTAPFVTDQHFKDTENLQELCGLIIAWAESVRASNVFNSESEVAS